MLDQGYRAGPGVDQPVLDREKSGRHHWVLRRSEEHRAEVHRIWKNLWRWREEFRRGPIRILVHVRTW